MPSVRADQCRADLPDVFKDGIVNGMTSPVESQDDVARHAWDQRVAPEMFWVSIASLFCLAGLLHLHDKPEFQPIFFTCCAGLLLTYPVCWIDAVCGGRLGSKQGPIRWLSCFLPPLRIGARDHATGQDIWLPGLGWQRVGYELEQRLERISSLPMIVLALFVLPLSVADYLWASRLETDPLLSGLLNGANGLIWFAFAGEFILRLSIADSKWTYLKEHIVDLAIVLLPLFSFLQALRLGRLMRLQQLARTSGRLYRLRGVALRAWRALLLVNAVSRIINGPPQRRLVSLRQAERRKERELAELRKEIAKLESLTSASTANLTGDSQAIEPHTEE
jgi:hypothetical protein